MLKVSIKHLKYVNSGNLMTYFFDYVSLYICKTQLENVENAEYFPSTIKPISESLITTNTTLTVLAAKVYNDVLI